MNNYYLNIIYYYLNDINDVINFIKINKKCGNVIRLLHINNINLNQMTKKNISLFNHITTLNLYSNDIYKFDLIKYFNKDTIINYTLYYSHIDLFNKYDINYKNKEITTIIIKNEEYKNFDNLDYPKLKCIKLYLTKKFDKLLDFKTDIKIYTKYSLIDYYKTKFKNVYLLPKSNIKYNIISDKSIKKIDKKYDSLFIDTEKITFTFVNYLNIRYLKINSFKPFKLNLQYNENLLYLYVNNCEKLILPKKLFKGKILYSLYNTEVINLIN